jgi:hypothetical protein
MKRALEQIRRMRGGARHRFVRDTLRDSGIESLDMSAFASWVPKLKAQMQ